MNLQELKIYAIKVGIDYPSIKQEVNSLVELCETEIEDGSSIENEIRLCKNDIEQLIEELK